MKELIKRGGLSGLLCLALWIPLVAQYSIGYDFANPTLIAQLPQELSEISGLGMHHSGRYLLAIQDEAGSVFFLDKQSGEVDRTIVFWDEGDYEGVEMVGNDIYVMKNTGTLYQIINPGSDQQRTEKFNGFLSDDNDMEGFGYEPRSGRLLLACKGDAGEGYDKDEVRAIFSFDPKEGTFNRRAVLEVVRTQMLDFLKDSPRFAGHGKLVDFFEDDFDELGPSGLAVHPITGDIFLISSVGKVVMVLNPLGEVIYMNRLDKHIFPQPEGLCFDSDGTLYMSSEGKGGPGLLYRLPYRPNR